MQILDSLRARALAAPRHIILPEGKDDRTLQAARWVTDRGYARISIIGKPDDIHTRASGLGFQLNDVEIIDHLNSPDFETYVNNFLELRKAKGITSDEARKAVSDPLYYANLMVRAGQADGTVAGATNTTAHTVRAALQCLGVQPGLKTVSSFFLMVVPNTAYGEQGAMIFSDCGVVINPDPVQLAEITLTSADTCREFLAAEPRVAMLSFSTKGSAKHEFVDKVVEAVKVVKARKPELCIDGELQLDAALLPRVAHSKAPGSPVDGQANVLIFPDIQAGNIGYKMCERMSGGVALGPVLQGIDYASNDLSRGCKAEDIVDTVVITVIQAHARERRVANKH